MLGNLSPLGSIKINFDAALWPPFYVGIHQGGRPFDVVSKPSTSCLPNMGQAYAMLVTGIHLAIESASFS